MTDRAERVRVVLGFHPVRELLRSRPHEVEMLLIGGYRDGARRRQLEELAHRHQVRLEVVERSRLDRLAGDQGLSKHNGFAAQLRGGPRRGPPADGDSDLIVLLEDVQDPRNLGALLRVCEGAGVGRVLIRDRGSAPLSATATAASAGASEWLAIERITNSGQLIRSCQQNGYWVYGTAVGGSAPWELDLTGPVLVCLGGEGSGLRRRTRELCDVLVGLPMRGRVESLNVSTAAAAILYEAVRQRQGKSREAAPQTT